MSKYINVMWNSIRNLHCGLIGCRLYDSSGDAVGLNEGWPAVCGLRVQWGWGGAGGGRRGEGGGQWNKQDEVVTSKLSHFSFSFYFDGNGRVAELFFFSSSSKKGGSFGGMFGMLKGLVGSKSLTRSDMEAVLDKMREHLIGTASHLHFSFLFRLWWPAAPI